MISELASELLTGIIIFVSVMMMLVLIVLTVRRLVIPNEEVQLTVNNEQPVRIQRGQKLITALAQQDIFIPSACGGRGTCGQCMLKVLHGNDGATEIEKQHLTQEQIKQGTRLACMVRARNDLAIDIPKRLTQCRRIQCRVVSAQMVSIFMIELIIEPIDSPPIEFEAGDYMLLHAPEVEIPFATFSIPAQYKAEWNRLGLFNLKTQIVVPQTRAYSLANSPAESQKLYFLIKLATPPSDAPLGTPAGQVSSYVFSLKAGDIVSITGPMGDFHLRQSTRELMFIGGGAGMAPLRSMIRQKLLEEKSSQTISFWYGARSRQQLCYQKEFERLAETHDNFSFTVALSDPKPEDKWNGSVGFIHSVILRNYLSNHPNPSSIDYYLCGPPVMSVAVITMLESLHVPVSQIMIDSFGGNG